MPEIGTSGLMSEDRKRSVATWSKPPRLSSTLPGGANSSSLLGGAAAMWPVGAAAQRPERTRRIGVMMGIANDAEGQARIAVFRGELERLGWVESHNVQFDYRWA